MPPALMSAGSLPPHSQLKTAEEGFAVQLKECKTKINAQQKELDTFKDLKRQFEKTQACFLDTSTCNAHLAMQGDHKHVSDANSLLQAQLADVQTKLAELQRQYDTEGAVCIPPCCCHAHLLVRI